MAAEIASRYPDADIQLIASGGGRFEVSRDGVPIFEKSRIGRHAEAGEVLRLLESR